MAKKPDLFIVSDTPLSVEGGIEVDEIFASMKEAKEIGKDSLLENFDGDNYGRYIYKVVPVLTLYREEQQPRVVEVKP